LIPPRLASSPHPAGPRARLALCALVLLGPAAAALADGPPRLRPLRPTVVRLGAALSYVGSEADKLMFSPSVTVGRQLTERFAVEGGVGGTQIMKGGETIPVSASDHYPMGVSLDAAVRATLVRRETGALTSALGAQVSFLRTFGPAGLGRVEVAWHFRGQTGFDILAGGGLLIGFIDSRTAGPCGSDADPSCRTQFKAGDRGLFGRVALGQAF